eukprot:665921_1
MSTLNSFLSHVCCIVIFTNLDTWCTSSAINTYPNEICSPDNWMVIQGDWSFNNTLGSCTITNDMSGNNIAILPYKSWTYLNTVQDPTYQIEIEYNFTITSASANNTIGSVGVIWFFDAQPDEYHDYMGVSFKENEAFVAKTLGVNPNPRYDNMDEEMDFEYGPNGTYFTVYSYSNRGALPLQLSVNTLYSLRLEIHDINDWYASHDIYINSQYAMRNQRTYTTVGEHNTSWIGLKSSNVSVISHSLTVYQQFNPDNGDSMIDYFTWTGDTTTLTTSIPQTSTDDTTTDIPQTSEITEFEITDATTDIPQTSETTDFESTNINPSITRKIEESAASTYTDTVISLIPSVSSDTIHSNLFNIDIIPLVLILFGVIVCLCCCGAAIVCLLRVPSKKAYIIDAQVPQVMGNHLGHVQYQGERGPGLVIPVLAKVPDVDVPANITTQDDSDQETPDTGATNGDGTVQSTQSGDKLRQMHTPDGQTTRGVHCGDCGVALINVRVFVVDGVRYCSGCHKDELYKVHDTQDLCYTRETLSPDGNTETVKGSVGACEDCEEVTTGKRDKDGSFFCEECWKMYENQNNTSGFIQ